MTEKNKEFETKPLTSYFSMVPPKNGKHGSRLSQFRKLRIGKLSIMTVILAAILGVSAVSAAAYVVLTWTTTATVVANPNVSFVTYPSTKVNTFNYAVNIFPSIKTVDENITDGIWNWDSSSHAVTMWIQSITNPTNISLITTYVKYQNGTTLATLTWATSPGTLPTDPQAFTVPSTTKLRIWTEITATSGATPAGSSVITYELKEGV